MTYKRKYPKIVMDGIAGVIIDDKGLSDIVIMHQELKGKSMSKSRTSGIQEAIDMAMVHELSVISVAPPKRKVIEK